MQQRGSHGTCNLFQNLGDKNKGPILPPFATRICNKQQALPRMWHRSWTWQQQRGRWTSRTLFWPISLPTLVTKLVEEEVIAAPAPQFPCGWFVWGPAWGHRQWKVTTLGSLGRLWGGKFSRERKGVWVGLFWGSEGGGWGGGAWRLWRRRVLPPWLKWGELGRVCECVVWLRERERQTEVFVLSVKRKGLKWRF